MYGSGTIKPLANRNASGSNRSKNGLKQGDCYLEDEGQQQAIRTIRSG